jgi:hypothetical protein
MIDWREVPSAPSYEVNNYGQVRRVKRSRGTKVNHILKPWIDFKGYEGMALRDNGNYIKLRVHSIVAEAFIGPCPMGHEVHHIDCNRLNNQPDNLLYMSKCEHSKSPRNWNRKTSAVNCPTCGRFMMNLSNDRGHHCNHCY